MLYILYRYCCSCSAVSNSLWLHGLQHTRFPCPLSPRVCSNFYPLSQGCHPTISSSVISSYLPQSFTGSGSFPMSWLFASCFQSIGASASASIFPMNIQGWYLNRNIIKTWYKYKLQNYNRNLSQQRGRKHEGFQLSCNLLVYFLYWFNMSKY